MEYTTCTLCTAMFPQSSVPIIGEDPKQAAGLLLVQLLQHMTTLHQSELATFQHAATQYLTMLVLGSFDIKDEVLSQDAEKARAFALRALSSPALGE